MMKLKNCITEEEIIREFTSRVINEIQNSYNVPEEEIIQKMDDATFFEMIKERPNMVMYQSPKDWAREVMEDVFF